MLSRSIVASFLLFPTLMLSCGEDQDSSSTTLETTEVETQTTVGNLPQSDDATTSPNNPAGTSADPTPTPEPVSTAAVPPPEDDCYEADEFICAIEHHIIQQTNALRGTRTPMTYSRRITFSARDWSRIQGERGSIGHDGFTAQRYQTIRDHFGGTNGVRLRAENVAYSGGLSGDDAEAIARRFTNMWWNSSGHRANMLGNHSHIGVGVYKRGNSTYFATQIFGSDSN